MDAIVAERATLTIDQVLEALATANSTLPVDAMQWSLDNWDIAAPHFLTLLDAIANGADPSRRDSDILFFALHMMGEKRETAAFPPLCRVMHDRERLEGMHLQDGTKIEVVSLPMPAPLYFDGQRLPASYANFYIANAAVLVPTFNDPNDRVALGILAELFTDRPVIGIHAVDLVLGFGTIHCLTQQEPAH